MDIAARLFRLLTYRHPEKRMGQVAVLVLDRDADPEVADALEHDLDSESHAAWMRATRKH